MTIPLLLLIYAITLALAIGVRKILLKRAVLDLPNERSSHSVPVPRGGGLALIIVLVPGMLATALMQHGLPQHGGLILGTIMLALVSWLDDRRGGTGIGMRLSMHIAAACIGSLAFTPEQTLFHGALPFWLDRSIMIIGWAWFINLYNFMDGIDGISGVETISIATGVCFILSAANIFDPFADTLTTLLIGASLGFLALNWHPAKLFLGDVGSVPLGYLSGFLLVTLAVKGQFAPALIIPAYYLADSGITLVKRAMRCEKFWQAHRQHFYQHAALAAGRHDRVVVWIIVANIALIAAAIVAVVNIIAGLAAGVIVVALLLLKFGRASSKATSS